MDFKQRITQETLPITSNLTDYLSGLYIIILHQEVCPIMHKKNSSFPQFIPLILLLSFFILLTRIPGITYNMVLHPDEEVFFRSTDSLLEALVNGEPFIEVKEYPEGAYLFHLPFHFFAKVIDYLTDTRQNLPLFGRLSSAFYFSLAAAIGMLIMWEYLGKTIFSVITYGLTMCFSLFFIEHSRYGVGDMSSLFLLLLNIYLTAKAFSSGYRKRYLFLACIVSGAMGAVKYPQLLFLLIPLVTYGYSAKHVKKPGAMLPLVLSALISFLAFSPKAMLDWGYFLRVIQREAAAYVTEGTQFEAGGLLNHIASSVVYSLLYADFPLSFALLTACFVFQFRNYISLLKEDMRPPEHCVQFLFRFVVPIICIIFFIYNLFVKLLIFRTYTPFFGISALYASYWATQAAEKSNQTIRALIIFLICVMVGRGAALLFITSSQTRITQDFTAKIQACVDENWTNTFIITSGNIPMDTSNLVGLHECSFEHFPTANGDTLEIAPGTLVLTGFYEHAIASDYIIPTTPGDSNRLRLWKEFKAINADYRVGQSYPDAYYYLFGGWIRGGTLGTSLIPCNLIYYRP